MGFSAKQVQALRRHLDERHVRTRESNGRELSCIEGWYAISEANRIFGFDGRNRETVESKCVLARETRGAFMAVYTAKVRITVQPDGVTIIREGHGTGEGRGETPGEVHDTALKAAETDATKRALATFGRPFGLELYRGGRTSAAKTNSTRALNGSARVGAAKVGATAEAAGLAGDKAPARAPVAAAIPAPTVGTSRRATEEGKPPSRSSTLAGRSNELDRQPGSSAAPGPLPSDSAPIIPPLPPLRASALSRHARAERGPHAGGPATCKRSIPGPLTTRSPPTQ